MQELTRLVEAGKVTVLLPDNARQEFYKNRHGVLRGLLRRVKDLPEAIFLPAFKGLAGFHQAIEASREARRRYSALRKEFEASAKPRDLTADGLVERIFHCPKIIDCGGGITEAAKIRHDLRRPRMKNDGSIGDAVNWKALKAYFKSVRSGSLTVISGDGDYLDKPESRSSESDPGNPMNSFFRIEWQ